MSKVPAYHYEIQENGEWHYFVKGKLCDIYDYRRAVTIHAHEERVRLEKERDEYRSRPRGTYITKTFRGKGIKNAQLAPSNTAWNNDDQSCYYRSFKELDTMAKASGQCVNAHRD